MTSSQKAAKRANRPSRRGTRAGRDAPPSSAVTTASGANVHRQAVAPALRSAHGSAAADSSTDSAVHQEESRLATATRSSITDVRSLRRLRADHAPWGERARKCHARFSAVAKFTRARRASAARDHRNDAIARAG
nr:MAG: hypothetical protein DIU78_13615 [Pseudomonadota bacterium]